MFLCGAIPEHCCDSSTDLDEKATFERLPVVSHLRTYQTDSLSLPDCQLTTRVTQNGSRSDFFV